MRVLLADDQVWLRSALRLLLENEAKLTVVGETGSLSLLPQLVAKLSPDLLFLDWQLPGLNTNGARLGAISSLRASNPNLFIVALTDDAAADGCLRLGADAQINRAEPPDTILTTVRLAQPGRARRSQTVYDDYLYQ